MRVPILTALKETEKWGRLHRPGGCGRRIKKVRAGFRTSEGKALGEEKSAPIAEEDIHPEQIVVQKRG